MILQFDAEVDAKDKQGSGGATVLPDVKWVPAEEVASCKTHADSVWQKSAEAAKKAQEKAEAMVALYQAQYPKKLFFGYDVGPAESRKAGLGDGLVGRQVHLLQGAKVLALYEINEDGKPSLIQYSYADGLYTVPKLLYDGYFAIGTKKENKLTFHRERSKS